MSPACDWVHAHLHRVEGDLGNAAYWYRRAGKTMQADTTGGRVAGLSPTRCWPGARGLERGEHTGGVGARAHPGVWDLGRSVLPAAGQRQAGVRLYCRRAPRQ